jgi:hypothetical protein
VVGGLGGGGGGGGRKQGADMGLSFGLGSRPGDEQSGWDLCVRTRSEIQVRLEVLSRPVT